MTSVEIPGTSKVGKVVIANSDESATEILNDFATQIRLDLTLISQKNWDTTVRIARSSENGGIETAMNVLRSDLHEVNHANAKERRTALFEDDYNSIQGQSGNADTNHIFDQCYEIAINGEGPNFTYGEDKTRAEIQAMRTGWSNLGAFGTDKIHGFHSYEPQNKAKAGKSNVGDTKEKRGVQSDFIVFFGARKINAHVNVKD